MQTEVLVQAPSLTPNLAPSLAPGLNSTLAAGPVPPAPPARFPLDQGCACCHGRIPDQARRALPHAFAGQPICSAGCLETLVRATLAKEQGLSTAAALDAGPRVRIGQILVEQGVITEAQLERALRSQRLTGAGRLGSWLRQQTQLPEEDFAAALSIQWQCPVFRVGAFAPERMAPFLPKQLVEACCALPLRVSREPERLTICFEDRLDYELLRACERMHGIPVEAGLLSSNEFWYGNGELLKAGFAPARPVEASSLEEMALAMTETMLLASVASAQLVFVHGLYWLRMWAQSASGGALAEHDVLCTLRPSDERSHEGQLVDEMIDGLERRPE